MLCTYRPSSVPDGFAQASACALSGVIPSKSSLSLKGNWYFPACPEARLTTRPSPLTSTVTFVPGLNCGISAMIPETRKARLFPHFLISVSTCTICGPLLKSVPSASYVDTMSMRRRQTALGGLCA